MELEQLHSDVIINIMKFCDVKSLLRFSETSKRYNEIMSSTAELTKRICFNMKAYYSEPYLKCLCNLTEMHKAVVENKRKYTKATLAFEEFSDIDDEEEQTDEMAKQFRNVAVGILQSFGKSITEFKLRLKMQNDSNEADDELKRIMRAMPNVKKLSLRYGTLCRDNTKVFKFGLLSDTQLQQLEEQNFNFMASVEELNIDCCDASVLQLFRDCTSLKSLEFAFNANTSNIAKRDEDVSNFLARQTQLKQLKMVLDLGLLSESYEDSSEYANWNLTSWPTFGFKLTSIDLSGVFLPASAIGFITQQNQLESLSFLIRDEDFLPTNVQQLHDLMEAILALPKLKKLSIQKIAVFYSSLLYTDEFPDWLFADLHNDTIKELHLGNHPMNFIHILNALQEVEKIKISEDECTLDVSELRLDVIKKISVDYVSVLTYSPPIIPDRVKFEEALTYLIKQGQKTFIRIGHPDWLHCHEFQLSIEFCKMLVDKMERYCELELYNVHDCHDELKAYLKKKKLHHQVIKLNNKQLEWDQPKPKKRKSAKN